MEEIRDVLAKYDERYVSEYLNSVDDLNSYAARFYRDVAEIFDSITRIRNIERNPDGFSIDDAPILGLLVRVWKLLKEVIRYYEENNAEFLSLFERPLIEAAVTATYLMQGDSDLMLDYRKCSYKDRLRILRDLERGSPFFETKAGQRLLASVQTKMDLEGLTKDDFGTQKQNRWRIHGKSFYDIFAIVEHQKLYACTYGMMSESIHGSWNESLDFCLTRDEAGQFKPFPFFQGADIRYISPLLRFCTNPYRLWLKRIDAEDDYVLHALDWVERFNAVLFYKFDKLFDG